MSSFDTGNLVYLVVLLAMVAGWFFVQNRQSLGRTLQNAAAWVLIFIGTIAAIGLWGDIRQTVAPQQMVLADKGRIEIPLGPDGHYHLTARINDAPVRFIVDTGASGLVLTRDDARRAGLEEDDLIFYSQAMTANGAVRTAPVVLDRVAIGPFEDRGIAAFVNEGEMAQSLLGMSYLRQYSRLEIASGRLVLER